MNQLPEATQHPTRADLHRAAVLAVEESRRAKARGDRKREVAWLKFAEACTDLHLLS